jgi:hypothetical protein
VTARRQEVTERKQEVTARKQEVTEWKQEVTARKQEVTARKREVTVRKREVTVRKREVTVRKREVTVRKQEVTGPRREVAVPPASFGAGSTDSPPLLPIGAAGCYLNSTRSMVRSSENDSMLLSVLIAVSSVLRSVIPSFRGASSVEATFSIPICFSLMASNASV